jgi:hypothetical protein
MNTQLLPIPRSAVSIRPAAMSDLAFIDSLQKLHAKQVGWMPTKALEQKIGAGEVLIAEMRNDECGMRNEDRAGIAAPPASSSFSIQHSAFSISPVGYLIAADRYMKREDCGIIYQMNVVPAHQRGLIGATLVRAMFERAAYGCRLFCCWCAQDIEANRFWESLGFIPLAFRAGSREKGRVHIFWQRRVRAGDATTPYWFPSRTTSGSIREDRLVFPIPPGVHWRDEMPRVLPGADAAPAPPPCLPDGKQRTGKMPASPRPAGTTLGRLQFTRPVEPKAEKPARQPKPKAKNDARLVAAARELRDRYLEHVNRSPIASVGKYDVARALDDAACAASIVGPPTRSRALPAPAAA